MTLASPRIPEASRAAAPPPAGGALDWPELHRRHDRRVRLAVLARLRQLGAPIDRERVDELAQEVWCRLLKRDRARRPGPRGEHDVETAEYLRRVARSVVIDAWRSDRAAKRHPGTLGSLDSLDGDDGGSCADSRGCPLRRAQARDHLRDFLRHCRRLLGRRAPRERFAAVRLVWVEGLTSPEAARVLGGRWTAGAVDCLLMRLRRRLLADGLETPVRAREARG
jgi:DNA-directed RNA polymerase specialized sigma24 family protein